MALSTRFGLSSSLSSYQAMYHESSATPAKFIPRPPVRAPGTAADGIATGISGLTISAASSTAGLPPLPSGVGGGGAGGSSSSSSSSSGSSSKRPAISYAAERVIGSGSFGVV